MKIDPSWDLNKTRIIRGKTIPSDMTRSCLAWCLWALSSARIDNKTITKKINKIFAAPDFLEFCIQHHPHMKNIKIILVTKKY